MKRGAEAVCSERYAILAESLRGLDPVVFENTAMVHCARQQRLCRLGELRCCACADVKARGDE